MKENGEVLSWGAGGLISTAAGVFYACSEPGCCDDEMTEGEFLERYKDDFFNEPE
jgi:hypothetical protein